MQVGHGREQQGGHLAVRRCAHVVDQQGHGGAAGDGQCVRPVQDGLEQHLGGLLGVGAGREGRGAGLAVDAAAQRGLGGLGGAGAGGVLVGKPGRAQLRHKGPAQGHQVVQGEGGAVLVVVVRDVAKHLEHEDGAGDAASSRAASGLRQGAVVVHHQQRHVDGPVVPRLGTLGGQAKVEPVARVVHDDQQHLVQAVHVDEVVDRGLHLRRRGAGKHTAAHGGRQHPLAHKAHNAGLVAGPAAAHEADPAGGVAAGDLAVCRHQDTVRAQQRHGTATGQHDPAQGEVHVEQRTGGHFAH